MSRLFQSSPGRAAVVIAVTLALMLLGPGVAAWGGFAAVMIFSITDPFLVLRSRSWWAGALVSVPCWIAVFVILGGAATQVGHLREGAMIFLLPMMIYPIALTVSGVVRLMVRAAR
jgi:hypothetical protein